MIVVGGLELSTPHEGDGANMPQQSNDTPDGGNIAVKIPRNSHRLLKAHAALSGAAVGAFIGNIVEDWIAEHPLPVEPPAPPASPEAAA